MELSKAARAGLQALGDDKIFPPPVFKLLVGLSLSILLREKDHDALASAAPLQQVDAMVVKQAYHALVTLFTEAARANYEPELLSQNIADVGVPPKKLATLTTAYDHKKADLQLLLSKSTFHQPHIVDVVWRLDQSIKTDALERDTEPLWVVTLKVQDQGSEGKLRDITFTCDYQQMQDLMAKLKDSMTQVDRVLGRQQ